MCSAQLQESLFCSRWHCPLGSVGIGPMVWMGLDGIRDGRKDDGVHAGLTMSYRGGSPRDLPRTRGLTGEFWQSSGRGRLWNLHVKQRVEKKTDM